MAGILVLGELNEGKPQTITAEMLTAARGLAEGLGEEVAVAFLGSNIDGISDEAISQGADRVYLVQDTLLAEPQVDAHLAAFDQVCRQTEPTVVLVGRSTDGIIIAPRLAIRLGVGVAQDSVAVEADSGTGRVTATRPVYGGNAMAKFTFPDSNPQMVVVRGHVYEPLEPDTSRTGETVQIQVDLDPSVVRARMVQSVTQQTEGVRLEDAPVVIGGGRGIGGEEPFTTVLDELARLLGGAVGASRAVCDAGWMDHSRQIGLTGKTISSDLYITVGISGASQHMAGCSGVKNIVAINRDADANIFKSASFGVVGDWKKILPSFVETVRELVNS
jgi:electron transfer flavoprotein alpha subunit